MKENKELLKLMMLVTFFAGIMLGQAWMHPQLFYEGMDMSLVIKIMFIPLFVTIIVGLIIFNILEVLKIGILFFLGIALVNITVYFQIWVVSEIILFITMIVLAAHLIKHRDTLFFKKK